MPTLQPIADPYELAAARLARSKTTSLAECVPLLDVALDFIDRGPAELTIEAVESLSRSRDPASGEHAPRDRAAGQGHARGLAAPGRRCGASRRRLISLMN